MSAILAASRILLILVLLSGFSNGAHAQEVPSEPTTATLKTELANKDAVIADLIGQLSAGHPFTPEQSKAIAEARAQALVGYHLSQLSYNQNGDRLREHQQRVFAWQMRAANWLLLVVVIVSLSGVVFAGYEMVSARNMIIKDLDYRRLAAESGRGIIMSAPPASPPNANPAAGEAGVPNAPAVAAPVTPALGLPAGTILIEPNKIHITSAVIGIVILGLSLGFLYLFLREVYAIDVIQITDTGRAKIVSTRDNQQGPLSDSTVQK